MKTIFTTVIALFLTSMTFSQCPGLQSNLFTQDETCPNMGDGSAFWNPSGSTGPFNFSVFEDGSNNLIYQGPNNSLSGLFSGPYYLVIEDLGNTCNDTSYFQILSPSPIFTVESIQNTSCGQCDGFITTNTTGGTPPYIYNWTVNGNAIGTSSSITGLCPDVYVLEVVDANGCSEIQSYTVTGSTNLSGSTSVTNNSIGNCDGSITTSVSGGVLPYSYSWSGPNSFTSTQQNISALCAGNYQLSVTDANGCTFYADDSLVGTEVISTYNQFDAMCFGQPTGGVDVYAFGGSGNYNLDITDGSYNILYSSTSMSYFNLMAGNYFYIVTDLVTSDADTVSFFINEPPPMVAFESINDDPCGQCDGSISVNVTGGTPPYAYNWSNGTTTPTITNLCQGVYFVDIIDANGCIITNSYTVSTISPPMSISGNITPATCGLCDGSIDVTITGSSSPYSFLWDDPTSQNTEDATLLCAGFYTISVTDNNGCSLDSTFYVNQTNNMIVSSNSTNSSCIGCTGTADIFATGGVSPYTYDLQSQFNSTGVFTGLCPGVQTILVTDANGCTGFDQVFIDTDTLSIPSLTISSTNESTVGANDGTASIDYDTVAHPNVIVSWSPANSTENNLYNVGQGWQTISLTDTVTGECTTTYVYIDNDQTFIYISGTIFTDADGDCMFDTGEAIIPNQTVIITDGINSYTAITNNLGQYTVLVPGGNNYTVSTTLSSIQSTSCNNSVSVSGGTNNISGVNIGLTQAPTENLCIWSFNFGFVPGFSCQNPVNVYNSGTTTSSGVASFVVPPMTTFDYAFPSPDNIVGDTLFWNVTNLAPGQNFYIDRALLCDVSAPLGTFIETCASVELLGGGQNTNPNCASYCYWNDVSGSFDPNDKTATPRGDGASGDIGVNEDEFVYTIRFQNTGTGPAVNIYITDTLEAMLDRSTLEMISSSHPYQLEYYASDVVRWRFNNINLPDSGANEIESHGYVAFKIKTSNTPVIGQVVENTANIYFDFNEPVITNTTLNTYAEITASIKGFEGKALCLFPNPANDEINILSSIDGVQTISIFDVSGKLIKQMTTNTRRTILEISDLPSGIYTVRSIQNNQIERSTFIKN